MLKRTNLVLSKHLNSQTNLAILCLSLEKKVQTLDVQFSFG